MGVIALRLAGFDGFISDGDWRIDGTGMQAPLLARTLGGGNVNFIFGDGGVVDRSSNFFFLKTSATRFSDTGVYDLLCADSGCISDSFSTYAPSGAVPEPAEWALMLGGFAMIGSMARRRRLARVTT